MIDMARQLGQQEEKIKQLSEELIEIREKLRQFGVSINAVQRSFRLGFGWKGFSTREKWKVTWGTIWRGWILALAFWVVLYIVLLAALAAE